MIRSNDVQPEFVKGPCSQIVPLDECSKIVLQSYGPYIVKLIFNIHLGSAFWNEVPIDWSLPNSFATLLIIALRRLSLQSAEREYFEHCI